MRATLALVLLGLAACRGTLSPLSNRIEVGQKTYVVFTADGEGGVGDLFASDPGGGDAWQITFSRVDERAPALSPDGVMLAFVRSRAPGDTSQRSIVVMNLLNGAERVVHGPEPMGPAALAWSRDGSRIFLRAGGATRAIMAPPAARALETLDAAVAAVADSQFAVLVGAPSRAEVGACRAGPGLCVRLVGGPEVVLTVEGEAPARWQGDSVVYLAQGKWVVHPLAGGRTRVLEWSRRVTNPRELTLFHASR